MFFKEREPGVVRAKKGAPSSSTIPRDEKENELNCYNQMEEV